MRNNNNGVYMGVPKKKKCLGISIVRCIKLLFYLFKNLILWCMIFVWIT